MILWLDLILGHVTDAAVAAAVLLEALGRARGRGSPLAAAVRQGAGRRLLPPR